MNWSRFNKLFRSDHFGPFLYNALSNTLIELDEPHYEILKSLNSGNDSTSIVLNDRDFNALLREKLALVEPGEEEGQLVVQQYQRHAYSFDSSDLDLTICPTLRCNFRCPYCFESSQADGKTMSQKTQKRLVDWITRHKKIKTFHVSWYGGEPLLAFKAICELTGKFKALDLNFDNADLITNGYLLDKDRITRLNDLKIVAIQITLDGPREVHDSRRFLAGGGPTFDRILGNVTNLMNSDYNGRCNIRVNVDRHNIQDYLDLRVSLLEQFKDTKLSVYPGFVDVSRDHSYGHGTCLNIGEWADFNLEMYREHSVPSPGGLYPEGPTGGMCIATTHNGFVVGPEGELYKCFDDVGKTEMVVGNIHEEDPITNPVLRALYITGMDAYNDPECRSCEVLPICGGSCVNKRMRTRQYGEKGLPFCSPFKEHLREYLNAYIDAVRSKEVCSALFTPGRVEPDAKGYRVISPKMKVKEDAAECSKQS